MTRYANSVEYFQAGGHFVAHEDGQSLTVLVNLSEVQSFEGGGTAFWSPADKREYKQCCTGRTASEILMREAPTLALSPPPGSAILFGGEVTHAGLEVSGGVRGVFVASFSPRGIPSAGRDVACRA